AGGLVPSASALILLLGAIAADRPAYGLALAVAFGFGMAIVLSGIGLAVVRAGGVLDKLPSLGRLTWFAPALPWLSAAVVTAAGIFLTSQALVQRFYRRLALTGPWAALIIPPVPRSAPMDRACVPA